MDLYYLLNYLVIKYSIIENIFLIISSDLLNKKNNGYASKRLFIIL